MAEGLNDRHKIPGAELIRKGMNVLKNGIAEEKEGLREMDEDL